MRHGWSLIGVMTLAAGLLGASWAKAETVQTAEEQARKERMPELQFAVISDIHVQHWKVLSHLKLQAALEDLSAAAPAADALVINGDLGNGLPADYAALEKLMRALPHPEQVYYTIGNHEFYQAWFDSLGKWNAAAFPNGETEEASVGRFLAFTGYPKVYHDAWVEGYHFLFLGSEAYRQSDPSNGEDAWMSEEQLQWLEKTIGKGEEAGKPIFVFLHQPLPGTVAGSRTPVNNRAVVQHERLKAILSKHHQAVLFTGHTHWELSSKENAVQDGSGFTMVNTSSVYEPYTEEDLPYEEGDRMSEGLTVEVYPKEVRIRGRNFAQRVWVDAAEYRIPLK
ncbi:metallophosphoesterase family protein [Gorillibacterium sp. sgz5001074]|uniref:metallophosphoesterase family protein n=1 Tax=Gorillibacterium sp. sgz5001074 TaxID=3446695 RepID=UPI003F67563D